MALLLLSHELQQILLLRANTSILEVVRAEQRKTVVEKVKLDEFLVKPEIQALVVVVALHLVRGRLVEANASAGLDERGHGAGRGRDDGRRRAA